MSSQTHDRARHATLCGTFTRSLVAGEESEAEAVTRRALRAGLSRREIFAHVMAPAMHEVGRLWAQGELTVLEEHVATAITAAVIDRLPVAPAQGPGAGLSAVVGCPAPEQHSLGARMFAETLREDGWNVIYVGAGVPVADLMAFVELRRPDLVGLSVGLPAHVPLVAAVIETLRALPHPPKVITGGYACANPPGVVGADAVSTELSEGAALALELVGAAREGPGP